MTEIVRDALIVAVSDYSDRKLRQLRAPAVDAERLAGVLRDPSIGGFRVEVASDVREGELRRRLARFFANRHPDDLLLVHFSCHGVKDDSGELYLAAMDTDSDVLAATGVASGWLNDQIGRCRSKRIVVLLDCCFSGSFPFGSLRRAGEQVNIRDHLGGRGRAVITASNSMEFSYEGNGSPGPGSRRSSPAPSSKRWKPGRPTATEIAGSRSTSSMTTSTTASAAHPQPEPDQAEQSRRAAIHRPQQLPTARRARYPPQGAARPHREPVRRRAPGRGGGARKPA